MNDLLLALLAGALAAPSAISQAGAQPDDLFLPSHREEGCWVSFFGRRQFRGDSAQLRGRSFIEAFESGPVVEPDLAAVGGQAFLKRVRSLAVGPNARLVGYAEPGFRDQVLTVGPGRNVVDLSVIEFHERVRSLKVFCEGS
jgi:hypothetical protein